jgi:hypothetical protein
MSDITMTLMRLAAQAASLIPDVPASLAGTTLAEETDKLLRLQAAVADDLTRHTHEAIVEAARALARRIYNDAPLLAKIVAAMAGASMEEAVSVAFRICAGCTDGAKAVRGSVVTHPVGMPSHDVGMEEEERRATVSYLKTESAGDAVYAAGVSIGPLDKKLRNLQEPTFDGIDEADQDALWPEYFRRYPR